MTTHEELIEHLKGIRYIAINICHGGFGLSQEAIKLYLERASIEYILAPRSDRDSTNRYGPIVVVNDDYWSERDIARDDPILIGIIRDLGKAADGKFAELKVVKIPADVEWYIEEYDGKEWVAEKHRTWQ